MTATRTPLILRLLLSRVVFVVMTVLLVHLAVMMSTFVLVLTMMMMRLRSAV